MIACHAILRTDLSDQSERQRLHRALLARRRRHGAAIAVAVAVARRLVARAAAAAEELADGVGARRDGVAVARLACAHATAVTLSAVTSR